ncbi:MAG: ribonuclease H-like domain-containing protein [Candidatus Aenigmatarchaeota archaeon]|nr:MAG: ribonuclease H-like domain-containing protein [Candidatus Aenigmarchaeota archaeon]
MVRFFIIDVQQSGPDKSEVMLWGRTEKGEPALVIDPTFRPYFFVECKDGISKREADELMGKITELSLDGVKPVGVEFKERKLFGKEKKLIKITLPKPADVIKFRDTVKEWNDVKTKYEHSITFYRRYLIDTGITPLTWVEVEGRESTEGPYAVIEAEKITALEDEDYPKINILALDIELVEEGDEEKIIMVSVKDNRGFRKVLSYKKANVDYLELVKDEKGLIQRLSEIVRGRDPDIIVTYNGDRFDFKHLSARANKFGIKFVLGRTAKEALFKRRGRVYAAWIEGRVHLDLFNFVENILTDTLSSDSLSLDSVSREILGKGKKRLEWDEMQKAWENSKGLERVVKYCMTDSDLALSLSKVLLPQITELCRIVGQGLFDTSRMTYSQLVEWLLMRESRKTDELIPNRPKFEEIQIRRKAAPYTGGYVYPPKGGIHQNIALFDFMSLYPSITITHNVSPETLNCGSDKDPVHRVPGTDHYYCKTHPGFIPETLKKLVKKRREIKDGMDKLKPDTDKYRVMDNRQHALKILANASYGYYGYAGSRWYSRVCAQSITAWGRYYIQKVIRKAEKMDYEVVYGDTDSLFVRVRSRKDAGHLLETVNKTLPGVMELEFQGLYKAGIFVPAKTGLAAKKRYALIDDDGEITIRGFEIVRRDWSLIARETQEKILLAVLRDRSPEKALNIAKKTVQRIKKGDTSIDKMIIHTQLTRPLKEYEQIGPHVVAAKKALQRGRPIAEGSMISYVISKGTGTISDRAEPAEDAENYDPEYYVNNQVLPASMRVLAALGCKEVDVLSEGEVQYSLKTFIKKGKKR